MYERGEDAIRQLAGLAPLRRWPGRKIAAQVSKTAQVTNTMLREYDYWTQAMSALHAAYGGMCAYLARYIELDQSPTTDHFVALLDSTDPMLAYTWSNYRLACSLVNGCKSHFADVLDPFEVGDGWFALDLNSFKTEVGPRAPPDRVDAIQEHHQAARARRARSRGDATSSSEPVLVAAAREATAPALVRREAASVLARELRRQGRLNPADASST